MTVYPNQLVSLFLRNIKRSRMKYHGYDPTVKKACDYPDWGCNYERNRNTLLAR